MKYVAIDLKVTSKNIEKGQIIEFAAIIDDLNYKKKVSDLPFIHMPVRHNFYQGDAYELFLASRSLQAIACCDERTVSIDHLGYNFWQFLCKNGYDASSKIMIAGINNLNFFTR